MIAVVKLNTLDSRYSRVSDDYVIINRKLVDLKYGKAPNIVDAGGDTYNRTRYELRTKDGKTTSIDASRLSDVIEQNFFF